MASPPLLTARQFRLIEDDLPAEPARPGDDFRHLVSRHHPAKACVRFRKSSACRGRGLHEWESVLAGSLPDVMRKLRLTAAPAGMHRRGGTGWRRKPDIYQRVQALRLENFGAAPAWHPLIFTLIFCGLCL